MTKSSNKKQKKTITILVLVVLGMFGFGFLLVPFYSVFCQVTGINGKTSNTAITANDTVLDPSREITVEFTTTKNADLDWDFYPKDIKLKAHPGEVIKTAFFAKNNTDNNMTVQAIPSVSPGTGAKHLKKIECFCFRKQEMDAHSGRDMPLLFVVDKDLPKDINTLTLSYTLFDISESKK